jgi:hypothetical protein
VANTVFRKAKAGDLEGIFRLAEGLKVDYDAPQKTGFLVYPLNREGYKHRIDSSDFFYVADNSDDIVGFLMCYDSDTLRGLMSSGAMDHEDAVVRRVSEASGEYVFGDQIGVVSVEAMNGVGSEMMERLFDDMWKECINVMRVGILHEPVENVASKAFCKDLGFVYQNEVTTRDGHVWGIYELRPFESGV